MKKTLTAAALSSVLVLGLASSALALHETAPAETQVMAGAAKITIDGSIRERGFTENISIVERQDRGLNIQDLVGGIRVAALAGQQAYVASKTAGGTDAAAMAAADAAIKAASGKSMYSSIIYDQANRMNRTGAGAAPGTWSSDADAANKNKGDYNTYETYDNTYVANVEASRNAYATALTNKKDGYTYPKYDATTQTYTNTVVAGYDDWYSAIYDGAGADGYAALYAAKVAELNTAATFPVPATIVAAADAYAKATADANATKKALEEVAKSDFQTNLVKSALYERANALLGDQIAAGRLLTAADRQSLALAAMNSGSVDALIAETAKYQADNADYTEYGAVNGFRADVATALLHAANPAAPTAAEREAAMFYAYYNNIVNNTVDPFDTTVDPLDASVDAQAAKALTAVKNQVNEAVQKALASAVNPMKPTPAEYAAAMSGALVAVRGAEQIIQISPYNAASAGAMQDPTVVKAYDDAYAAAYTTAYNTAKSNFYNDAYNAYKTAFPADPALEANATTYANSQVALDLNQGIEGNAGGDPSAADSVILTNATNVAVAAGNKAANAVADLIIAGNNTNGFSGAKAVAKATFQTARAAGVSVADAQAAAIRVAEATLPAVKTYHENENLTRSAYDNRVRLGVKAQIADATGYVQLESNDTATHGGNDVYTWGANSAAGLNEGGHKTAGLGILQAWIDYKPGDYGVKVGHMPLALGNKVFFDHTKYGDDAIVAYANLGAAAHVAALTIKFDEQNLTDQSDDLDGYVLLGTYKANDTLDFGANLTYLRGSSSGDPLRGTYDTFFSFPTQSLVPDMSMSNLGLNANYKVGAISLLADLEMQFGTVMDINGLNSIDANGWALKLGGTYDLGPAKVGLLYGYGTGQDETANDSDMDAFVTFLSNTNYDTIIAGYRAAIPGTFAATRDVYGVNTAMSGLSNLSLYQLNASAATVCPLTGKNLSLFASATYMNLNEDHIIGFDMDSNGNTSDVTGDSVGTELDLIASWALNAGLSYKVEAAYLFAGDAWDTQIITNTEADDQYFLRHSLELKF